MDAYIGVVDILIFSIAFAVEMVTLIVSEELPISPAEDDKELKYLKKKVARVITKKRYVDLSKMN